MSKIIMEFFFSSMKPTYTHVLPFALIANDVYLFVLFQSHEITTLFLTPCNVAYVGYQMQKKNIIQIKLKLNK